jgi:phage terminase large subunit-like protein
MAGRSKRLPVGHRRPEWSPENETLEHFERFAWTLRVPETGDRLVLRDFQLCKLEDYFAADRREVGESVVITPTFFENLWLEPSGNGKSGLLGALALHHGTYCVPKPRVFVVGGELEHARNTTNAVAGFILESRARGGLLGSWWEPQEIYGGRVVPLWLDDQDVGIFARSAGRSTEAKGGSSVEGKNPTLILVEELHRHQDGGAAVNTLKAKTIKSAAVGRTVKVVTITTAGTNRQSPLGRMLDRMVDEDAGAVVQRDLRPGEYYARSVDADGETVAHMWEVPESISPPRDNDDDDEALEAFLAHVKKANPADWISVKTLKRVWKSMTRHGRWMFLRQNANMWVATGFAAFDRGQWWRLKVDGLEIPAGKGIKVFVGLDRASKWDSTAIVPVWRPPDNHRFAAGEHASRKVRVAGAVLLESPKNGKRRRTRDVAGVLNVMRERWPDMVIVFDRNAGGGDVAEELEEEHGLTIIDHDQGTAFDLASMRLGEYVEEGKLEHDGHEALSTQVLAAVMKETSSGRRWRGEAPDDDTLADGFDGVAMALHMATAPGEPVREFNPDDYRIERL